MKSESEVIFNGLAGHEEVVESHHRFSNLSSNDIEWNLSHLDAFAMRLDPGLGFEIDVVVLFSCHCFSCSIASDGRPRAQIPDGEIYNDGREERVLNFPRYELSRRYLPSLIRELPLRTVKIGADSRQNFFTLELIADSETIQHYIVYFEPEKDRRRSRRVLLRVQSAYPIDALSERQRKAGKVSFRTLLKAAYVGRRIRG
jgi:hypothetical protein